MTESHKARDEFRNGGWRRAQAWWAVKMALHLECCRNESGHGHLTYKTLGSRYVLVAFVVMNESDVL